MDAELDWKSAARDAVLAMERWRKLATDLATALDRLIEEQDGPPIMSRADAWDEAMRAADLALDAFHAAEAEDDADAPG